ncbi:YjbQ family protein [candidate division KSB1 bacterium]|jgi:secondary thiamine-phosphate synthase enzyme|nr:YjbQ family protein [candidate division KSB1 bacterium]
MQIKTDSITVATNGHGHVLDLTGEATHALDNSGLSEGHALLFVSGSTAALTTIEFEPGLIKDIGTALERLVPESIDYAHDATWGDGNGHSHIRASLLGPSLMIPFAKGRFLLGTWQQLILIDMDNRARNRSIVIQFTGV